MYWIYDECAFNSVMRQPLLVRFGKQHDDAVWQILSILIDVSQSYSENTRVTFLVKRKHSIVLLDDAAVPCKIEKCSWLWFILGSGTTADVWTLYSCLRTLLAYRVLVPVGVANSAVRYYYK